MFLNTHCSPEAAPKFVPHGYEERHFAREIREGGGVKAAPMAEQEERQLQVAGARESRTEVLARLR
jgi:hypothetical protein